MTEKPSLSPGDIIKVTTERMSGNEAVAIIDGWSVHVAGAGSHETVIAQVRGVPGEVRCEALRIVERDTAVVDMDDCRDKEVDLCDKDETEDGRTDGTNTHLKQTKPESEAIDDQLAPSEDIVEEQDNGTTRRMSNVDSGKWNSEWEKRKAEIMSDIATSFRS